MSEADQVREEKEIRISVRRLIEFLLRSGDIDNRRMVSSETAMAEGSRIHRRIQKSKDVYYRAEVGLSHTYRTEFFPIIIEGRADGIWEKDGQVMIDEIKGTYRDLQRMTEPASIHLAQAKCYAYMYGADRGYDSITVQMTYCNLDTEEIRYFTKVYSMEELTLYFTSLMKEYEKWARMEYLWKEKRQASIQTLKFPYAYRSGQKELAAQVYQTIYHKKKLFLEAPTGVGKTLSTIFPAVKAVGEKKGDRIFYLTAKTITRTVAEETYALLRKEGLLFKTVTLTARDKICVLQEPACNPEECPRAKGHFDRVNEALFHTLTEEVNFSREKILEYAEKYQVCPFELGLDISLFCDGIICDYNYVFDPTAYLRRFFGEGTPLEQYLFLIDEAHNLVDRGREMYSASLYKSAFAETKAAILGVDSHLEKLLAYGEREMLKHKRETEDYRRVELISSLLLALNRIHAGMEDFLERTEKRKDLREIREQVLKFYFDISFFLETCEELDEKYVIYEKQTGDDFYIRLFCVDPSNRLKERLMLGRSSILFSATLLPIQYYKRLLGGDPEDYEVYAPSSFSPGRCGYFLGMDVTTRYTRRSDEEYGKYAAYIHRIVHQKRGNYLVFFPSYAFLREVYECYMDGYHDPEEVECICQGERMQEQEREEFLMRFKGSDEKHPPDAIEQIRMPIETIEDRSLVGFCVMGGIFGEGIDLKRDALIGALIVGCGIPQVGCEREILKEYFDENGNGFDYAYRFVGMNKVLQAAGRVIRTAEDVGIVALLDERFDASGYRRLFPREWTQIRPTDLSRVEEMVSGFWKSRES